MLKRFLSGLGLAMTLGLLMESPSAWANTAANQALALHALDRLGFGPGPGDLARLQSQGPQNWAWAQVQAEPAPSNQALPQLLAALPILKLTGEQAWMRYRSPAPGQPANQAFGRKSLQEARLARLMRCVFTERPLEERLVIAFNNHLHVAAGKAGSQVLLWAYQEEAIRPHVWGSYRAMLGASVKHPAMLRYLDNFQNVAPGHGRRGLNENHARELLELHTLGVHGGYGQGDVEELARALTGWGLNEGRFQFRLRQHVAGVRKLLGQNYPQSGQAQAEAMLDALAMHPATAQRLATMLAQRFVSDRPPSALVTRMAQAYLQQSSSIPAMVRCMLAAPEFWAVSKHGVKLKDPLELVASSMRLVGPASLALPLASSEANRVQADPTASQGALRAWRLPMQSLNRLGALPWAHAAPDGDPYLSAAWLGPEASARRVEWAMAFVGRGTAFNAESLMQALGSLPEAQAQVVRQAPPRLRAALVLASPRFQRR